MLWEKRAGVAVLIAAMAVFMLIGCRNEEKAFGVKAYYAAIESGAYYEDWARQLGEQAQMQGLG